jgi:hypothetical protein
MDEAARSVPYGSFGISGDERIAETVQAPFLTDPDSTLVPKQQAHFEVHTITEARDIIARLRYNQHHLIQAIMELIERDIPDVDPGHYKRLVETVQKGQLVTVNHYMTGMTNEEK